MTWRSNVCGTLSQDASRNELSHIRLGLSKNKILLGLRSQGIISLCLTRMFSLARYLIRMDFFHTKNRIWSGSGPNELNVSAQ